MGRGGVGRSAGTQRGVGAALVNRAARDCFALGVSRAYLCARPQRSGYYEKLGWISIERDVGHDRMSVLVRDAVAESGAISRSPP